LHQASEKEKKRQTRERRRKTAQKKKREKEEDETKRRQMRFLITPSWYPGERKGRKKGEKGIMLEKKWKRGRGRCRKQTPSSKKIGKT